MAATPGVAHNVHAPHTEITASDPTTTHHTNPTAGHPHIEVPHA